jgi:hypothetical protein
MPVSLQVCISGEDAKTHVSQAVPKLSFMRALMKAGVAHTPWGKQEGKIGNECKIIKIRVARSFYSGVFEGHV